MNGVPLRQNVTNEYTKWQKVPELHSECRWFEGPRFLYEDENKWPNNYVPKDENLKKAKLQLVHIKLEGGLIYVSSLSSWLRLLRSMAYVCRFVGNMKSTEREGGPLNQNELQMGEI